MKQIKKQNMKNHDNINTNSRLTEKFNKAKNYTLSSSHQHHHKSSKDLVSLSKKSKKESSDSRITKLAKQFVLFTHLKRDLNNFKNETKLTNKVVPIDEMFSKMRKKISQDLYKLDFNVTQLKVIEGNFNELKSTNREQEVRFQELIQLQDKVLDYFIKYNNTHFQKNLALRKYINQSSISKSKKEKEESYSKTGTMYEVPNEISNNIKNLNSKSQRKSGYIGDLKKDSMKIEEDGNLEESPQKDSNSNNTSKSNNEEDEFTDIKLKKKVSEQKIQEKDNYEKDFYSSFFKTDNVETDGKKEENSNHFPNNNSPGQKSRQSKTKENNSDNNNLLQKVIRFSKKSSKKLNIAEKNKGLSNHTRPSIQDLSLIQKENEDLLYYYIRDRSQSPHQRKSRLSLHSEFIKIFDEMNIQTINEENHDSEKFLNSKNHINTSVENNDNQLDSSNILYSIKRKNRNTITGDNIENNIGNIDSNPENNTKGSNVNSMNSNKHQKTIGSTNLNKSKKKRGGSKYSHRSLNSSQIKNQYSFVDLALALEELKKRIAEIHNPENKVIETNYKNTRVSNFNPVNKKDLKDNEIEELPELKEGENQEQLEHNVHSKDQPIVVVTNEEHMDSNNALASNLSNNNVNIDINFNVKFNKVITHYYNKEKSKETEYEVFEEFSSEGNNQKEKHEKDEKEQNVKSDILPPKLNLQKIDQNYLVDALINSASGYLNNKSIKEKMRITTVLGKEA
eukprot:CAMPEP_0170524678 /NCGR_PEP_ID=MMETSP0209-20121228/10165_1 /TAXON_ID=665100 ORGANISM="Litonotus pictus, Strain P1" /NCGR_SAMPLE_ID=MMETSP0209 /ASSEMBLY_ACC=CAM_ASM_000301 /LENGTH=733 /DNA_ID=CAMNT_0010813525 /DNA_START=889 /DNA_END=3091 /DNA_ORIENTATION=-